MLLSCFYLVGIMLASIYFSQKLRFLHHVYLEATTFPFMISEIIQCSFILVGFDHLKVGHQKALSSVKSGMDMKENKVYKLVFMLGSQIRIFIYNNALFGGPKDGEKS